MRKVSVVACSVLVLGVVAGCSSAPGGEPVGTSVADLAYPELNPLPRHMPTQSAFAVHQQSRPRGGGSSNLSYHGGGAITTAAVVPIFWGPSWSPTDPISTTLSSYIANYGTTGEYNVITQYYQVVGTTKQYISESPLGGSAIYDSSTPPTNVTDADVQAEVIKMVPSPKANTIYEVFLPSTSYSSDGSADSCGGPHLQYCAYHSNFTSGGVNVKYASMPYPSCGGCQSSGFTVAQNFEHFISHETREAVTDEDGTAWYDNSGYEADDKCAWSPAPFVDSSTGYAYQYEWSNANSSCIASK